MKRVSVVGCSGAGKTTVAAQLARALAVPHLELDALHWGPDWRAASRAELADRVNEVIAGDVWVVDGNYQNKIGTLVWTRADTVVWVDPPRWKIMAQVTRRTLTRFVTRRELWNGNIEPIDAMKFWKGGDSVLAWAWKSYPRIQQRYETAMGDPRFAGLRFYRLRARDDIESLIALASGR